MAEQQLGLFGKAEEDTNLLDEKARPSEVRRLVPARDDLRPLYVTGHGLSIGKTGGVLQIKDKGSLVQEVRLNEISGVHVFGNVQVTGAAVQGLCWADKPIAYFSTGGWFYGLTRGLDLKNVFPRKSWKGRYKG